MEARVEHRADAVQRRRARNGKRSSILQRVAVWLLCLLSLVPATPALATSYLYDANGRIIAITNDAGESARYVYDVMGNITRVDRLAVDELALFAFSPGRGVSGMQVRLQGHGFDSQPTANVVRFAGIPATVVSGSVGELLVLVPAGAVTGPISVTVGSQSVASSTDFVVDQNAQQPRIDAIAPEVVNAGATVTVTGGSLYPIPYQTTARIGARAGMVGSVQNTQLAFVVPTLAASGKVSVSTPYGMASSTQDLLVLPSGVSPADIAGVRRVILDAPGSTDAVPSPGQQFAVLVDAAAGELLDVQLTAISGGNLAWTLYDPVNRRLLTGTASTTNPTVLLPAAARAGTYLLLIKPAQAPANWNLAIERSRKLVSGVPPLAVTTTASGQKKRFYFDAGPEQHLGLGLSELAVSTSSSVSTAVHRGDVSLTTATCTASRGGCQLNVRPTQRGIHTLTLTPATVAQTFQAQLTLSDDLAVTLVREVPLELNVPRRGQNARLYFTAQAGESLALQVLTQQTLPVGYNVNYAIYRPDGTLIKSANTATHNIYTLPTLPQSGTYSVFVDGEYGASVAAQIVLRVGASSGGQIDGEPAEHETGTAGESVYFDFEVDRLDELVGVGISDLVLSSGSSVSMTLYRPDGTTSSSTTCYAARGGCGLNLRSAQVGRHTVLLQPANGSQTMRLKATVTRDLQMEVELDQPVQLDLDRRGQNARLFFETTDQQTLAFLVSGVSTLPTGKAVSFAVYTLDNVLVSSASISTLEVLRLTQLPAGRYYLFIDPADGAQVQARVTLTMGQVAGLVVDGDPVEYVAPTPGHPAFMAFTTTEPEQRLGLALHGMELSSGTWVNVTVHGPDGQSLGSSTCSASRGCGINVRAAVPGNYSLVVRPQAGQSMSFMATLSNDSVVAVARETPLALDIPRFGQNARLMFDAQAGDHLALQISGQVTSGGASSVYAIYKPDGTSLSSVTVTGFNQQRMVSLPTTGQYMILVDPTYGETLQARLLLTAGNGGAPVIDGEDGVVLNTVAGQATFATFQATAGEQLGLGISDLVVSTGTNVIVNLYHPGGVSGGNVTCTASHQGCALGFTATESGTYSVVVMPQSGGQTSSFKVTLSRDLVRDLPRDTPVDPAIARRGQKARFNFNGQAGEVLALQVAGQATFPAARVVYYRVYKPDGTLLSSANTTAFTTQELRLPVDGRYQLLVEPNYGETVNSRITLTAGQALAVDGAPGSIATVHGGQPMRATFQANAGQRLGVGVYDLAVSAGTYVSFAVYRPDGTSVATTNCAVSTNGCKLNVTANQSGTYVLVATPQTSAQIASYRLAVSQDIIGVMNPDQRVTVVVPRRGQNARLSFSGQAGQWLSLQVTGQATEPEARIVYYRMYRPDGTLLTSLSTTQAGALRLAALPVTGEYAVLVDSAQGETLQSQLTLASGSSAMVLDEASAVVATNVGGQEVFLAFTATEGQRLGVGLRELQVSTGTNVSAVLLRPDGTSASATCYVQYGGCELDITANATGVYRVYVKPQSAAQQMQFMVTASTDVEATLDRDKLLPLALDRPGQNGWLSFAGISGERLSLEISNHTTVPAGSIVNYVVYKPDGAVLTSTNLSSNRVHPLPALPVSGTYRIRVSPTYALPYTVGLTLK